MKIIFFDVDGVLNCESTEKGVRSKSRCGSFTGIDKDKVKRLATIVEKTNAKLVLISDWKIGWEPFKRYDKALNPHAKYLDDHLKRKGDLYIIDKTEDEEPDLRGSGIKNWLSRHPDVTDWIVLDDTYFSDYFDSNIVEHLILTDPIVGLTDENVEAAIKILNNY